MNNTIKISLILDKKSSEKIIFLKKYWVKEETTEEHYNHCIHISTYDESVYFQIVKAGEKYVVSINSFSLTKINKLNYTEINTFTSTNEDGGKIKIEFLHAVENKIINLLKKI